LVEGRLVESNVAGSSPVTLAVILFYILYFFMFFLNFEYFYIVVCLVISTILALVIIFLSYLIVFQQSDSEKISAYECGFQPFEEARSKFNIKFYLVAILFIIFDLEIMFLFPWSVSLFILGLDGFWSMCFFLFILTLGFIYEWKKGALDWE
jgi:NADH-quinone oxidoreductase subunit A